ncbi:MAG: GAF domain-containing protein [Pseudomonadota bacterium]
MAISIPENEAGRVGALANFEILDTAPELAYDEVAQLAAQISGCPVAIIGMIDSKREWLKAKYGLPPQFVEVPREITVCSTTICQIDLLVVPDLTKDERFRDYPMVAGQPNLRFYCGAPLINPQGFALGSLCIIDFEPREIAFEQAEAIRRLARQVVGQLELRRSLIELKGAMQQLDGARRQIEDEKAKSD